MPVRGCREVGQAAKFGHITISGACVLSLQEGASVETQAGKRGNLVAELSYRDVAKMIDHSLLQQTLTDAELEEGVKLALEYDVASVCIKPYYVARARELLADSTVALGTTVGFPHGGQVTAIKVA